MSQGHRVTWDEAQSFADLLAAFFRRTGRDPTDEETEALVATAPDCCVRRGAAAMNDAGVGGGQLKTRTTAA